MKKSDGQTTEHLLGIFGSLLRLLPANSAGRIRTLAKFVEKDYEKTCKLVKLRWEYASRVAIVDTQIRSEQSKLEAEEREDMADEWDSRRLDAGLFCLQTIDVILAWLVAEDEGSSMKIQSLLADRDESLAVVKATIQEQLDTIAGDTEEETMRKDMLSTLVQFL
jgi:beta-catenin-like protein 1